MGIHLDRARILLFDQSRPDLAEKELRQELATEPNNAFAHAMLGHALSMQENEGQGLKEAQEAIRLAPDLVYGQYILAWVLARAGRIREADLAIQEAIRLDPNDPDLFDLLSGIKFDLYLEPEALQAAEQGLRLDPHHVGCLNRRATALAKLGREKEAVATLQAALASQPSSDLTHSNLGLIHWEGDRVDDAVESLQESLRIAPNEFGNRALLLKALRKRLGKIHDGFSISFFLIPLVLAWCGMGIVTGLVSTLAQLPLVLLCFALGFLPFGYFIAEGAPEAVLLRLDRFYQLSVKQRLARLWPWWAGGVLPGVTALASLALTQEPAPSFAVFAAGIAIWTFLAIRRTSIEAKGIFLGHAAILALVAVVGSQTLPFVPKGAGVPYQLGLICLITYFLGMHDLALLRFLGASEVQQSPEPGGEKAVTT